MTKRALQSLASPSRSPVRPCRFRRSHKSATRTVAIDFQTCESGCRLQSELSGFSTFVRENLQIESGFVARVDVTMKIGSLEETITVSCASPVVDITTTRGGQTLPTTIVNRVLPTTGTMVDVIRLTPGLSDSSVRASNPGQMGLQGIDQIVTYGQRAAVRTTSTASFQSRQATPNRCWRPTARPTLLINALSSAGLLKEGLRIQRLCVPYPALGV